MANIIITSLPTATTITGLESVPIVQNGVTVQTTTGAIAASPSQTQTFITVGQQSTLANSRSIGSGTGLTITDGGAQGALTLSATGALLALVNSGTGIQVKTSATTVSNVQIVVGTGLTISNATGVSGNPTLGLATVLQNIVSTAGIGLLAVSGTTISATSIAGTTNQISVTNGTTTPTVGLASNPVVPGVASLTLPLGGSAVRPGTSTIGMIRYNSDLSQFEGYTNIGWTQFSVSTVGVTTFSGGTTGLTPSSATSGAITLAGVLNIVNGGTGNTTGSAASATNLLGGGTNQISYQTSVNVTGFIATPVTASTYLQWSGTSFVWQAITAYNPAAVAITGGTIDGTIIGSTTPAAGSFALLNATTSGATTTLNVTDTGTYGANIKLTGNGATTPNKYIRATNGQLQFVNSAYSNPVAYMDDSGNFTALSVSGVGTNLTGTATLLNIGGNAATATLAASATNALNAMGRNVIINGDQVIAQINGTTLLTPLTGSYPIDMVGITLAQPSKLQIQQQFGPLTALGSTGSLTTTVATSYVAAATEDFSQYRSIEGYNFQRFEYGTANAKAASLQFKVRASVGGTYSGAICNAANTRSYVFSYAVATNSDTLVQIPNIPGDIAGTWTAFTSPAVSAAIVVFDLGGGSSTKAASGSWQTGNYHGVNNSVNLVSQIAGSTLTYTDVQFEIGAFCTLYERKLYGPSLLECQRYLWSDYAQIETSALGSTTLVSPVTMRSAPTLSGGGTGFTVTTSGLRTLIVNQTTASAQLIVANAQI